MNLLPIIRITEFLDETVNGGTTRPMLVLGEDGNKYVLKIFSKKDAGQRPYTVAEVMANLLAREFELIVPQAVYLQIDTDLLESLKTTQPATFEKIKEKEHDKILFGSIYLEGFPIFSPSTDYRLLDLDELESIFALDMLIVNEDRRLNKPNILRSTSHYVLIDHEKAFEGLTVAFGNYQKGIVPYFFYHHLFYKKLHQQAKKANNVNFETFEEYFRILDIKRLKENVEFLIANGYDEQQCIDWFNYIRKQKENYRNFVALLKEKISE